MKRAEFVKTFVDAVQAGRRKNFPDIRPSENAAAAVSDMRAALRVWRKMDPAARARIRPEDLTIGDLTKGQTKDPAKPN